MLGADAAAEAAADAADARALPLPLLLPFPEAGRRLDEARGSEPDAEADALGEPGGVGMAAAAAAAAAPTLGVRMYCTRSRSSASAALELWGGEIGWEGGRGAYKAPRHAASSLARAGPRAASPLLSPLTAAWP